MIDTIKFQLNNVSKYPIIKTQYEGKVKQGSTTIAIDEDSGEVFDNSKILAILHHDSDSLIPLSKRTALHIPSSNYDLSYFYNYSQDHISFEFSVPKYIWGTNILQFVRYFDQDADTIFNMVVDFVKGFVKKRFLEVIDFKDLEITRLDLCYNQFFNSKYDAIKYLTEQKELLKKFARSTKNDYTNYESSFVYTTKRYSFKIYHKGTEFKKNDRGKLAKKNPTGHQIEELQNISDKILRYEVTFRKGQIDYLFEQNELHNKYCKNFLDSEHRSWLKIINPDMYARTVEFAQQSKRYVFANVEPEEAVQTQIVSFDRAVFRTMFKFFWDTVHKYQLKQKISVYDMVRKIDIANKKRDEATSKDLRAKLSFNKPMLTVLALLTQHQTIDDLRKSGLLSKTTFFRYKKQLKELGIDSETRLLDMPPPPTDYIDYLYHFGHHHIK